MTISRAHMKNRSLSKYAGPPFIATVKEATITKNKTKQTVSRISNCHFYYCLFWGVRGPVRTVVRGPGPQGGPWTGGQCFCVTH